jgi:hypothetical protein
MTTYETTKIIGRRCGECTLCCRLLPVRELGKRAGVRCSHQRRGKGCSIYAERPMSCRVWTCRWLSGDDTGDLSRPDRSHYCVDVLPDYVTLQSEAGTQRIPVIQIWVDPKFRDAHRDPALRAYLVRRGYEGFLALVRYDAHDGFVLCPPALAADGEWHEVVSGGCGPEHTAAQVFDVLNNAGCGLKAGQGGNANV